MTACIRARGLKPAQCVQLPHLELSLGSKLGVLWLQTLLAGTGYLSRRLTDMDALPYRQVVVSRMGLIEKPHLVPVITIMYKKVLLYAGCCTAHPLPQDSLQHSLQQHTLASTVTCPKSSFRVCIAACPKSPHANHILACFLNSSACCCLHTA